MGRLTVYSYKPQSNWVPNHQSNHVCPAYSQHTRSYPCVDRLLFQINSFCNFFFSQTQTQTGLNGLFGFLHNISSPCRSNNALLFERQFDMKYTNVENETMTFEVMRDFGGVISFQVSVANARKASI